MTATLSLKSPQKGQLLSHSHKKIQLIKDPDLHTQPTFFASQGSFKSYTEQGASCTSEASYPT